MSSFSTSDRAGEPVAGGSAGIEVSIVIPARNEAAYIGASLASVLAQDWETATLEAVVVVNGTTDATAEVVRGFAAAAAPLAVRLVEEAAPGIARARNLGIHAARGNVVIFLDADSRMAPNLVRCVVDTVRAGYPAGSIPVIADSRDLLDRAFFGVLEFGKRLFRIHAQMFYCRRDLLLRLHGFDERLRLAEDRELLVRLSRAGVPLGRVRGSWIATSPRRLHALPLRLGIPLTLARWALAHAGIGRDWAY